MPSSEVKINSDAQQDDEPIRPKTKPSNVSGSEVEINSDVPQDDEPIEPKPKPQ